MSRQIPRFCICHPMPYPSLLFEECLDSIHGERCKWLRQKHLLIPKLGSTYILDVRWEDPKLSRMVLSNPLGANAKIKRLPRSHTSCGRQPRAKPKHKQPEMRKAERRSIQTSRNTEYDGVVLELRETVMIQKAPYITNPVSKTLCSLRRMMYTRSRVYVRIGILGLRNRD